MVSDLAYHSYIQGTPKKNWRRCEVCGGVRSDEVHHMPRPDLDPYFDDDLPVGSIGTLRFEKSGWDPGVEVRCSSCGDTRSANLWWYFCCVHQVVMCDPCSLDTCYDVGGSHRFRCNGDCVLWERPPDGTARD